MPVRPKHLFTTHETTICPSPPPPTRNSEKNGAPKAVLSDKLKQFFPLADASALSAESLTAAFGKGGKDGLLNHALEQTAAATEKKVGRIIHDAVFDPSRQL